MQLYGYSLIFSGPRESKITEHCVWSYDGHVISKDISHAKLVAMGLLQTCGYVTEQMQTPVTIDVNKFLESFSIRGDGGDIHQLSWIPEKDNSLISPSTTALNPHSQSSSLPISPKPFTMEDYRQCRREEAISWINLQEKRASIIPRLHPIKPEEYQERRDEVNKDSGPLRRKSMNFHLSWET